MKVAVYCGSTPGTDESYVADARRLGVWLGENGIELVYGGSNTGLMGAVADGVLCAGGRVTGVIPDVPLIRSRVHPGLTSRIETGSMAERKTCMIEQADAFVALPGGLGTLDEITEILSLQSLGLVRGAIVFYNLKGYYEPMKAVFANILQSGFGRPEFFADVHFASSPEELAEILCVNGDGSV